MGISTIIYSQNLQGFPNFPTTNQTVFSSQQTNFIVPAGVNWIGAKIWGAGGGGCNGRPGSSGSYAELIISVTSGETLSIVAGSPGQRGGLRNGGWGGLPGGGGGGTDINVAGITGGAGGGGYSGIFINQNRPLVMVGGGGGAGFFETTSPLPSLNSLKYTTNYSGASGADGTTPTGCGGGGGGGFQGGEGGGYGGARQSISGSNRGTPGMTLYVSRDHYNGNLPRKIRVIYSEFSNVFQRVGYQGYGNGGLSNAAGENGRVEITY